MLAMPAATSVADSPSDDEAMESDEADDGGDEYGLRSDRRAPSLAS